MKLSVICKTLIMDWMKIDNVWYRSSIENKENRSQHRTLWDTVHQSRRVGIDTVHTDCLLRSVRYEQNQARAKSQMPKECWSLVKRMEWSMVSEAAKRSSKARMETLSSSKPRRSLTTLKSAVSVLCPDLYAGWCGFRRLFFSRWVRCSGGQTMVSAHHFRFSMKGVHQPG